MNAKTKVVIASILLLFLAQVVVIFYSMVTYETATYQDAFLDGCRAYQWSVSSDTHHKAEDTHTMECVVLLANHEHETP